MSGLDVNRHLSDMVMYVRVIDFVLGLHILQSIFISGFGCPQKSCRVMRYEARLPSFLKILAWISDKICIWNECPAEIDEITNRGPHADGIPPRTIDLHGGVGEITGHQKLCIPRRRSMANSARSCCVD